MEAPSAPAGRPDDGAMPRWVKVFAFVVVLLLAVFVVLHLTGVAPARH